MKPLPIHDVYCDLFLYPQYMYLSMISSAPISALIGAHYWLIHYILQIHALSIRPQIFTVLFFKFF